MPATKLRFHYVARRDSLCGVHRTIVTLSRTRRLILLKKLGSFSKYRPFFSFGAPSLGPRRIWTFGKRGHAFSVAFLDHNRRFYEGSDFWRCTQSPFIGLSASVGRRRPDCVVGCMAARTCSSRAADVRPNWRERERSVLPRCRMNRECEPKHGTPVACANQNDLGGFAYGHSSPRVCAPSRRPLQPTVVIEAMARARAITRWTCFGSHIPRPVAVRTPRLLSAIAIPYHDVIPPRRNSATMGAS